MNEKEKERRKFAAMAMQGIIELGNQTEAYRDLVVQKSILMAEALQAELDKTAPQFSMYADPLRDEVTRKIGNHFREKYDLPTTEKL